MLEFIIGTLQRHIAETSPLIGQISDEILHKEVVTTGRTLGEIILHIIRSFEYYSVGVSNDTWNIAPYTTKEIDTAEKIISLFIKVTNVTLDRVKNLNEEVLKEELATFNRKASKLELIQEMIEHSIQHRGQLLVYFRLLGLEPFKINYII